MTKYRVLRRVDAEVSRVGVRDESYGLLEEGVEAHSPQQAIRKVVTDMQGGADEIDGTYVAVPESNWTEEPVTLTRPAPRLVVGGERAPEPQLALVPDEPTEDAK